MPQQIPTTQNDSTNASRVDSIPAAQQELTAEQQYRAAAYSILAALLRDVPSGELIDQITAFEKVSVDEDEMLLAMSSLGLAARAVDSEAIREEFQNLFIGIGRGELVPYGSWYLTGYLMEQPLSALRDDLVGLGIERNAEVKEPEDHIASLCEVMSMLISEQEALPVQTRFFEKHKNTTP